MDLVPVEPPALRMALPREALKLLDAPLGIVPACKVLLITANKLVQALAERLRFGLGGGEGLLVYG